MLKDETSTYNLVVGDADDVSAMSAWEGDFCSWISSYQPKKRTLEPAGCLRTSWRKMCLLGRGPEVEPLICFGTLIRETVVVFTTAVHLRSVLVQLLSQQDISFFMRHVIYDRRIRLVS